MNKDSIEVTGTDQLHGIEADLSPMPDTANPGRRSPFRRWPHNHSRPGHPRVKETDRLAALQTELTRLARPLPLKATLC